MKNTATDFMAVCACSHFHVGQAFCLSTSFSTGNGADSHHPHRCSPIRQTKTLAISLLALALSAVWLPNTARPQGFEQPIHSFVYPGAGHPDAPLVQGSDGALYGTTVSGGYDNYGTVFKLSTNGGGCQVLYSFTGTNGDGAGPSAGLVQGRDGALYGTTYSGGTNNYGTVFKLSTNGGGYQVLYSFTGTGGDGLDPEAGLIQGSDGALYGTTSGGGSSIHYGTVFKLSTNGAGYRVLYSFTGTGGDGADPRAGLVQGSDGALYGTTFNGGTNVISGLTDPGTVFKLNTSGGGYQVIYSFGGTGKNGANPTAGLVQGSDGALYGTTYYGGTDNDGTVFKLSTNGGGYQILYSFTGTGEDGLSPQGGLVQGSDSALYGTTIFGGTNFDGGTVFKLSTTGSGYQVLYRFTGTNGDGAEPYAGLVQGSDGALYGTTFDGGGTDNEGTVFKLSTNGGGDQVLCSFTGTGGDGAAPVARLVQGRDGALYGTTDSGGTNGFGTVFKLSTNGGAYQVLYSFTDTGGDGVGPNAGLVQGRDSALYGTTYEGGTDDFGTVFKLSTNGGGYQVLYSFTGTGGNGDGAYPSADLVQGTDGALYGTTYGGGNVGNGTVFKLNTNGSGYQVLYIFANTSSRDGSEPTAGLVQGRDGALYGTTYFGGTNGSGTVFTLNTNGAGYQVLYNFTDNNGDGAYPRGGLVQGTDGALYGTTYEGGTDNVGTVFKLSTNGASYQVLYSFLDCCNGDGFEPWAAALVQGTDGALYGTTEAGGAINVGTVFKLSTNGAGYQVLYRFTDTGGDGGGPLAGLVQGRDGAFYGTTDIGGTDNDGTVFRLTIAPGMLAARLTNSTLTLTWSTVAGSTYQLQYNSNLNSTNWINLSNSVTASGTTLSATDSVTNGPRRFYRVVLLP